jgi:copper transport protein
MRPGGMRPAKQREGTQRPIRRRWALRPLVALTSLGLGLFLALLTFVPIGPAHVLVPTVSAQALHALPVRSDPPAHAILQAPPGQVRMWFSEDLNSLTSRLWVVDTANREVDRQNSHVSSSDPREMDVSLSLLPAGTYVVVWRTQSAQDGHVVSGSYYFRIARPDGSVPPVPAVLPTGHQVGAGGTGAASTGGLDSPTIVQTAATWLALLFMAFWVGGLIWETWILPPGTAHDPDLATAAEAAARRFRRLAPFALGVILLADVGIVLALGAELAGDWSGAFAPRLLYAVLFGSQFGTFWWLREGIALAALLLTLAATRRGWSSRRPLAHKAAARTADLGVGASVSAGATEPSSPAAIPDWWHEVLAALRGIPHLPRRLVAGWRGRSWLGRAELLLGAGLICAFGLSGHAAAVPASELPYALSVDLLHLLGNAAWLGGLLYISLVFIPALGGLGARTRARVLALGLPAFSAVALVSVTILAATGTLNATIHLTSITQFLTTAYGRTLAVKIELFLVMVAISTYHAFFLRPRLAQALTQSPSARLASASPQVAAVETPTKAPLQALAGATSLGAVPVSRSPVSERSGSAGRAITGDTAGAATAPPSAQISAQAQRLAERLEDWLRREAVVGAAILLCVALLAAFAGSLTPAAAAGASSGGGSSSGAFISAPQTVQGLTLTLKVTPNAFGTNMFTVTVLDAQQHPVNGASVLIATESLDMDMGVQTAQLQPVGPSAPGAYSGQSDLTMAGHWRVTVKVLPPNSTQFALAVFTLTATY